MHAASAESGRPRRTTRSHSSTPVSRPSPVVARSREDDVARLLAAEHEVVRLERGEHVAVADRRLDDVDARVGERAPQPEVRHHGHRDRAVAEPAPRVRGRARAISHDLVAVDDLAALVDREDAVGVAVEREADGGAVREHGAAQTARGASNRTPR